MHQEVLSDTALLMILIERLTPQIIFYECHTNLHHMLTLMHYINFTKDVMYATIESCSVKMLNPNIMQCIDLALL